MRAFVTGGGRGSRKRGRPAERLGPVCGETRGVLGVQAVAERVAHHLVGDHPRMPGLG